LLTDHELVEMSDQSLRQEDRGEPYLFRGRLGIWAGSVCGVIWAAAGADVVRGSKPAS
jgi:hypothetical protein